MKWYELIKSSLEDQLVTWRGNWVPRKDTQALNTSRCVMSAHLRVLLGAENCPEQELKAVANTIERLKAQMEFPEELSQYEEFLQQQIQLLRGQ